VDVGIIRAAAVVAKPQNLDDAVIETGRSLVGKQAQGRSALRGCCRYGLCLTKKPELINN
jgi:hypothetical protein